jgi:hypothetical protein
MKITIYLAAIPKNKNDLKLQVLKRFGRGVERCGDQVQYIYDFGLGKSDVAVMQGFVHADVSSPHLKLRRSILDNNENTVVIDSNLFQFANAELANYYLRYSLNGIFPTTGFYFDNKIDQQRWNSISQRLGVQLKDYRSNGNHILICLQRVSGWSMCNTDVQHWLDHTVARIRKFTDRPIVVRKHPGDRRQEHLKFSNLYSVSTNVSLLQDLENCWATVTFNSSPGVASLVHGVPVFVTDPVPQQSQTWPICNTDLSMITTPVLHDREEWINRLSQSHWNDEEIESGVGWQFMRERLSILKPNLC